MNLTEWISEQKALAGDATTPPWDATMHSPDMSGRHGYSVRGPRSLGPQGMVMEARMLTSADAAFIAASRTTVPSLLAAVEAVVALHVEVYEGECDHDGFDWPCVTVRAIADALGVAP